MFAVIFLISIVAAHFCPIYQDDFQYEPLYHEALKYKGNEKELFECTLRSEIIEPYSHLKLTQLSFKKNNHVCAIQHSLLVTNYYLQLTGQIILIQSYHKLENFFHANFVKSIVKHHITPSLFNGHDPSQFSYFFSEPAFLNDSLTNEIYSLQEPFLSEFLRGPNYLNLDLLVHHQSSEKFHQHHQLSQLSSPACLQFLSGENSSFDFETPFAQSQNARLSSFRWIPHLLTPEAFSFFVAFPLKIVVTESAQTRYLYTDFIRGLSDFLRLGRIPYQIVSAIQLNDPSIYVILLDHSATLLIELQSRFPKHFILWNFLDSVCFLQQAQAQNEVCLRPNFPGEKVYYLSSNVFTQAIQIWETNPSLVSRWGSVIQRLGPQSREEKKKVIYFPVFPSLQNLQIGCSEVLRAFRGAPLPSSTPTPSPAPISTESSSASILSKFRHSSLHTQFQRSVEYIRQLDSGCRPIDLLFLGSLTPHRQRVLSYLNHALKLRMPNIQLEFLPMHCCQKKMTLLDQAKIVLNLNSFDLHPLFDFEIVLDGEGTVESQQEGFEGEVVDNPFKSYSFSSVSSDTLSSSPSFPDGIFPQPQQSQPERVGQEDIEEVLSIPHLRSLLSRGKVVVSEFPLGFSSPNSTSNNQEFELLYRDLVVYFHSPAQAVDLVLELLSDPALRLDLERRAINSLALEAIGFNNQILPSSIQQIYQTYQQQSPQDFPFPLPFLSDETEFSPALATASSSSLSALRWAIKQSYSGFASANEAAFYFKFPIDWRAPVRSVDDGLTSRLGLEKRVIIGYLQRRFSFPEVFLEIGCSSIDNLIFLPPLQQQQQQQQQHQSQPKIYTHICVDPFSGSHSLPWLNITSDAYFESMAREAVLHPSHFPIGNDPKMFENPNQQQPPIRKFSFFDVEFSHIPVNPADSPFHLMLLDGLHEANQTLRDILHALQLIHPDGTILVHDCRPALPFQGLFPRPHMAHFWTGDVWKALIYLRTLPDIDVALIDMDWGLGVIKKRTNPNPLSVGLANNVTIEDYMTKTDSYLPFLSFYQFHQWL